MTCDVHFVIQTTQHTGGTSIYRPSVYSRSHVFRSRTNKYLLENTCPSRFLFVRSLAVYNHAATNPAELSKVLVAAERSRSVSSIRPHPRLDRRGSIIDVGHSVGESSSDDDFEHASSLVPQRRAAANRFANSAYSRTSEGALCSKQLLSYISIYGCQQENIKGC